jgi:hypothetical protein
MCALRSHRRSLIILLAAGLGPGVLLAAEDAIPRTPSGRPDLSGTYDAATLTPLERPKEFGDKLYMTRKEAEKIASDQAKFLDNALKASDPDREAPSAGGAPVVGFEDNPEAGEAFGAGNVGGYNWFWVDPGSDAFSIDGKFRTSILTEPRNGRMPPMTPEAQAELVKLIAGFRRPNDGTAFWLDREGPGPYDDMELRPNAERCLLGFTGTAPTLPSLYNNYKRIVQTDDHVMILLEMVHDARIVRMSSEHPGPEVQKWLGDSIGWWEGDTLVVETTNFSPKARGFRGGSENMRVVERFSREPDGDVVYNFKVEDKTVWTSPWGGEYIWKATGERMFEYACHEGNYALGNIMRGARLLEEETLKAR